MSKLKRMAIVAASTAAMVIALVYYCQANRISSYSDWRTRQAALNVDHPINSALKSGVLSRESTIAEVLRLSTPTWTGDFGRIKYYGFESAPDSTRTAIFVDGKLTTVVINEQTFSWQFMDDPDPILVDAMQTVRRIRHRLKTDPSLKESLRGELDTAIAILELPPETPSQSNRSG